MRIPFILMTALLGLSALAQPAPTPLSWVDPTIGGVGRILEPTRPTVHLPFSMVRVFPVRRDQLDDQISYFPLTISSHRQPALFGLLPVSALAAGGSWTERITYDREKVAPYHYAVHLEEPAVDLEFAPAARSGYFRFSAGRDRELHLRLSVLNSGGSLRQEGRRALSGKEAFMGMQAYFYAELNTDIRSVRYEDTASRKRLLLTFSAGSAPVELRYGVSFISVEQARENLAREIPRWDFAAVKKQAQQVWDRTLSRIRVEGGTPQQKRVFYTSLYRCYERMVDISEYGRYYSAYDHQVHRSSGPFYVDNWLWDTYIALEPLHTLLDPATEQAKIRSYITMYEQSGWMPSFALAFGDHPCMTGNHAAAWIADAWSKGLRDFDLKKAYEGLRKNALGATLLPWRNGPATVLDSFYHRRGYMPALRAGEKEPFPFVHPFEKRQAVSVTLENSYDDWCMAQLSVPAGRGQDRGLFLRRAAFYRNVFRTDKGFMWPRDSNGRWIEPFDPKFSGGQGGRDYTTENNVYTYNWNVKHDLEGLFVLMGGQAAAEAKLDQLFRESLGRSKYDFWYTFPDATGLVGQFSMGNEPSFHIPYLYNYLGAPWKTQKRIRMLLDTWFTDNWFGIPGDEDGGGMTSFAVFSMMGFFPVTPGVPVYSIGSPVFERITIDLPSGKTFTIHARGSSAANKYIQKASLQGRPWNRPCFSHEDLLRGGTLELIMGDRPAREWGQGEPPPSSLGYRWTAEPL